jgi:hypothetical protein
MFVTASISSLIAGPKWGLNQSTGNVSSYIQNYGHLCYLYLPKFRQTIPEIYMMLLRPVHPIASLFTAISQISIAPISPQTYTANAEAAINELQTRYNSTTGVYDTTGYEIFLFPFSLPVRILPSSTSCHSPQKIPWRFIDSKISVGGIVQIVWQY